MPYNGPNIVNPVPTRSVGEFFRAKAAFEAHRVNGNYPVPGASGYLEDIADYPYAVQQQIYESTRVPWVAPGTNWRVTSTSIEHIAASGTHKILSAVPLPFAELRFTAAPTSAAGIWTVGFAQTNGTFTNAKVVFNGANYGSSTPWAIGDVFVIRLYKTTYTITQNGVQKASGELGEGAYVAGFESNTAGHKLDFVTFLPVDIVWWSGEFSPRDWAVSRTSAQHYANILSTLV